MVITVFAAKVLSHIAFYIKLIFYKHKILSHVNFYQKTKKKKRYLQSPSLKKIHINFVLVIFTFDKRVTVYMIFYKANIHFDIPI